MSVGFIASVAVGAVAWSASEYALHRFVGHGPRRKKPVTWAEKLSPTRFLYAFNSEHLAHHADPSYFAPTSHKVAAAVATVTAGIAALGPLLGARRAFALSLGFSATYAAYEIVHRRVHTHAPRNAYDRAVRRHHLLHHHKTPKLNHGVTSTFWDHVTGSFDSVTRLRVPRGAAPAWMVDARGDLRSEYADDYELVGPKMPRTTSETPRATA